VERDIKGGRQGREGVRNVLVVSNQRVGYLARRRCAVGHVGDEGGTLKKKEKI